MEWEIKRIGFCGVERERRVSNRKGLGDRDEEMRKSRWRERRGYIEGEVEIDVGVKR